MERCLFGVMAFLEKAPNYPNRRPQRWFPPHCLDAPSLTPQWLSPGSGVASTTLLQWQVRTFLYAWSDLITPRKTRFRISALFSGAFFDKRWKHKTHKQQSLTHPVWSAKSEAQMSGEAVYCWVCLRLWTKKSAAFLLWVLSLKRRPERKRTVSSLLWRERRRID